MHFFHFSKKTWFLFSIVFQFQDVFSGLQDASKFCFIPWTNWQGSFMHAFIPWGYPMRISHEDLHRIFVAWFGDLFCICTKIYESTLSQILSYPPAPLLLIRATPTGTTRPSSFTSRTGLSSPPTPSGDPSYLSHPYKLVKHCKCIKSYMCILYGHVSPRNLRGCERAPAFGPRENC